MKLIYLAAPLSAPTWQARARNLARAQQLRDMLERDRGVMVFLPHERIAREHGYPSAEETDEIRAAAFRSCLTALVRIQRRGGALHVLRRPDGTVSDGCQIEIDHWTSFGGDVVYHGESDSWEMT